MVNELKEDERLEDEDKFFCRFTFGQFFALLVFQAVAMFFIFYLGAKYGSEFLGLNDSMQSVASREAARDQVSVESTDDPLVRDIADKLIEKAKRPELKEKIENMLKHTKVDDKPPILRPNEGNRPASDRSVEGENLAERAIAARDNMTGTSDFSASDSGLIKLKSSSNSRYSVQVGSYEKMFEATAKVDEWKKKGYPAYMMIADIPDRGRWYRVRIGAYENNKSAEELKNKVEASENVKAMVVLNEN